MRKYKRIVVIEDGVYEHITFGFDPLKLPRFGQIPDMWERTISIYSAGKLFSATGTRVGWCIGAAPLVKAVMAVHQYNSFCMYGPLQEAVGEALEEANSSDYY